MECWKKKLSNGLNAVQREKRKKQHENAHHDNYKRNFNESEMKEKAKEKKLAMNRSNEIESEPGRYVYAAGSRMYH